MSYSLIPFDAFKFDFIKEVSDALGVNTLPYLHILAKNKYDKQFEVGADAISEFHTKFYDKYRAGWEEMQDLYENFIKLAIAPLYDEDFLYQKFPTFRVHLKNNVAVGAFHTDAEFGHPEGEVNYIIPLTESDDTASVWVETEPGLNNFMPMKMQIGKLIKFDGNHLRHGNKINETDFTRVSMDFRVLPISKYDEANTSSSITLNTKFKEGAYYKRFTK